MVPGSDRVSLTKGPDAFSLARRAPITSRSILCALDWLGDQHPQVLNRRTESFAGPYIRQSQQQLQENIRRKREPTEALNIPREANNPCSTTGFGFRRGRPFGSIQIGHSKKGTYFLEIGARQFRRNGSSKTKRGSQKYRDTPGAYNKLRRRACSVSCKHSRRGPAAQNV